jgi:methionyl-tRNA synthetase
MLLSAGYEVPQQLFVHGHLLLEDRKISKSVGNLIDALDLVDVYGADAVRYSVASSVSFGHDGSISEEIFHERYERELGNDLGNLLSRTTAMIARYRDGRLEVAEGSADIAAAIEAVARGASDKLDDWDLTGALEVVWELVRGLNRHVEQTKPWQLAKDEARAGDLDRVLYELADGLRAVAVAISAYVPDTAARILAALGQPDDLGWANVAPGRAVAATGIEPAAPLFPRVEAPTAAA